MRHAVAEKGEDAAHAAGAPDRVDVGEVARRDLPRRGAPRRVERAERQRGAEVGREDARRDPGFPHPEGGEPTVAVRGLQLEEAQDVGRVVRRRDELYVAGSGREHPRDERP
jgi:hypothetical protein